MSEQEQISTKQELITILQESIDYIQTLPDEDIVKKKTKLNTKKGIGYLLSNDKIHLWLVNFKR